MGTLHAKAVDACTADPVLGDAIALDLSKRIDYDFRRLKMKPADRMAVVLRTNRLDAWVRRFLAGHPDAVVLHLGCGLDARAFRIDAPVEWFDVDHPDVIELRDRLFPSRDGYRTIAASVTETGWLEQIPADRTTLVIAEGLLMYLGQLDAVGLLRRMTDRFPDGEMMFDAVRPWVLRLSRYSGFLRVTGASFGWAVGDPHDVERQVPGLRLVAEHSPVTDPELVRMPAAERLSARAMAPIAPLRNAIRLLRYRF
ncbi:class I SAM-dependent methyltransferase [Saccharopolyspora taberi]|uniref:Class I SAM-dependent methyltransferase n=2 Tax=Saccharopolyspora taberi TaxID=60895 RepID=A0ABN3VJM2_9PSEU